MQDKPRPDTPIQRRTSARLAELPPANEGLTGDEVEKHGPHPLHYILCAGVPEHIHPECYELLRGAIPFCNSQAICAMLQFRGCSMGIRAPAPSQPEHRPTDVSSCRKAGSRGGSGRPGARERAGWSTATGTAATARAAAPSTTARPVSAPACEFLIVLPPSRQSVCSFLAFSFPGKA